MAPREVRGSPGPGPHTLGGDVSKHTISPAGDPFHAAARDRQDERPHACNDGWITLGQIAANPETEEYALYLCRRCADSR